MSVFSQSIRRRVAFTLNELLIVIAIIVLMLALAVPAFNVLTGSKSIEGATNQVSAFLGQARAEAIGIQEIRGVMFFLDLATDRINMALVRTSFTDTNGNVHLDLVPDRDFITLPPGIGLQTIDNPMSNGATPGNNDAFIGYNDPTTFASLPSTSAYFGGVILFDAYGKLSPVPYAFHCTSAANSTSPTATGDYSQLGSLFATGTVASTGASGVKDFSIPSLTDTLTGEYGFVLFDKEAFANAPVISGTSAPGTSKKEDFQITGSGSWTAGDPEYDREQWLATNGSIVLINRYNGTLIKGD